MIFFSGLIESLFALMLNHRELSISLISKLFSSLKQEHALDLNPRSCRLLKCPNKGSWRCEW